MSAPLSGICSFFRALSFLGDVGLATFLASCRQNDKICNIPPWFRLNYPTGFSVPLEPEIIQSSENARARALHAASVILKFRRQVLEERRQTISHAQASFDISGYWDDHP